MTARSAQYSIVLSGGYFTTKEHGWEWPKKKVPADRELIYFGHCHCHNSSHRICLDKKPETNTSWVIWMPMDLFIFDCCHGLHGLRQISIQRIMWFSKTNTNLPGAIVLNEGKLWDDLKWCWREVFCDLLCCSVSFLRQLHVSWDCHNKVSSGGGMCRSLRPLHDMLDALQLFSSQIAAMPRFAMQNFKISISFLAYRGTCNPVVNPWPADKNLYRPCVTRDHNQ